MRTKKITATFIGEDFRLEVGKTYEIDITNNIVMIHRTNKSDVITPYNDIEHFLNNWCNIEQIGIKMPKGKLG